MVMADIEHHSASSTPTMRPDCICFDNGRATPVPVAVENRFALERQRSIN
jgi:hypothetical protein